MKNTFIYGLYCPLTGDIKYIGKSNDVKSRYRKHKQMCDNNHLKNDWIRVLMEKKLEPIVKIIEEVSIDKWKEKEKFYIRYYTELGFTLLNVCGGGNGMSFGNITSFKGKPPVKVVCLDKQGNYIRTFDSIKDANKFAGKKVFNVLVGKRKSSGGYLWLYESKYSKMSDTEIENYVLKSNENNSKNNGESTRYKKGDKPLNMKKINQLDMNGQLIRIWDSIVEASLFISGKKTSAISNCLNKKCKTALGFKWSYNLS
jgi:predicted GIY-YIG superfamily endonuclease